MLQRKTVWAPLLATTFGLLLLPQMAAAQPASEMEWEPGEGYHEEEWYDPSDWFDEPGEGVSYEYDGWYDDYDYDYNDYYGYNYDWGYDPYDHSYYYPYTYSNGFGYYAPNDYGYSSGWDYGWYWDDDADEWTYGYNWNGHDYDSDILDGDYSYDTPNYDYNYDRQVNGKVLGLRRVKSHNGKVDSVQLRLRTDDGQVRTVQIGDYAYVRDNLPTLRNGERIRIAGKDIQRNGRKYFKVAQIRTSGGNFSIPDYNYDRVVTGRLAGLQRLRTQDGEVRAVVAKLKTRNGNTVKVLLGSPSALKGKTNIRPGDEIRVDGFSRSLNGRTTIFANDVAVQQPSNRQGRRMQSQSQG